LNDDWVTTLAIDAQGNKWVGTSAGDISEFNGTTWTRYTPVDDNITVMAIDAQGNKWIGTIASGIYEMKN